MRIATQSTAAVLIDVQERLLPHMYNGKDMLKNASVLLQGFAALQVPVMLSEQYKKGLGETVTDLLNVGGFVERFEKVTFSCVGNEVFDQYLEKNEVKNVILFGIETHVCVLQTAVDLKNKGLNPVVVWDAVASRFPMNKEIAIERFRQEGIQVTTVESLLFELCETAKYPAFKTISGLIK